MSWQEINETPVLSDEELKNQRHFDSLVYRTFGLNEVGKELLKCLENHYNTPVCSPDKESSWGYFREGQNSIIRQFKHAIFRQEKLTRETNDGK